LWAAWARQIVVVGSLVAFVGHIDDDNLLAVILLNLYHEANTEKSLHTSYLS